MPAVAQRELCGRNLPVYRGGGKGSVLRRMSFTDLPRYNPEGAKSEAIQMIKRYSDHAANERTFLAWVRTAIAVMAFGFVIERFDLFLQLAAPQLALKQAAPHGQMIANMAGLAFIGIGVVMIVVAGFRFRKTAKEIESEDAVPSPGERSDLALAVLLVLLGLALFLYLSRAVLPVL
jgi:putative membrane protein